MKTVDSTTFGPFHHLKIFDLIDQVDNGKTLFTFKTLRIEVIRGSVHKDVKIFDLDDSKRVNEE